MTYLTRSSAARAIRNTNVQARRVLLKAAHLHAASISGNGYVVSIKPRMKGFVQTLVCYVVVQGPDGVDIPYRSANGYSSLTTHLQFENTGEDTQDHKKVIDKVLEVAKQFRGSN